MNAQEQGPIYQQIETPAGTVTFRLAGEDLTIDRGAGFEPAPGVIPKKDIPGVKAAMRESA
jgi:hypothetical protein